MSRLAKYDVLFEPVRIGPKTAPNRFYQVPFSTGFGAERPREQARFRATRAEGGWGTVCVELCSISPESDRAPLPVPARLWDDDDMRNLTIVCDEVHRHGSLVGVELWHGGANVDFPPSRLIPGAPSPLPSDRFPLSYPRELDVEEIHAIQERYVMAARRARSAGFDILYVYGAHGNLPSQFLSPFYNKRTDGYGGSLENRARFWIETLQAVRSEVGDSCAVVVRLGIDPSGRVGVDLEETLAFIRLADAEVDLWDVNTSVISRPWLDMTPSRTAGQGSQLPVTSRVREATEKPIVGVSRLTDPDLMVEMIRSGAFDLIGGARPSIADPFLPAKIRAGRNADIRECIGCNLCISRIASGYGIACTQNPTAGEEYRRGWHPERVPQAARRDRKVIVIGAGVAGMECAITLAKAGMQYVELVEGATAVGGHAVRIAQLPGLGEWRRLVAYRDRQLAQLDAVDVAVSTTLGSADILDRGAEIVVVATGALWSQDGVSHLTHEPIVGARAGHVLTPDDLAEGRRPEGDDLLVYDCEGYFMGVAMAELLAVERPDTRVRLVTPFPVVGPFLDLTFEADTARRRLDALDVQTITGSEVRTIAPYSCQIWRFDRREDVPADGVVLVTSRRAHDDLHRELRSDPNRLAQAGIAEVHAIGDCASPRHIAESIFDGQRIARAIGGTDPNGFMRDLRVVTRRPAEAIERADLRIGEPSAL